MKGFPETKEDLAAEDKLTDEMIAEQNGATAAARGRSYDTNPYSRGPLRVAWSNGHNGMRARMLMDREGN